MTTKFVQLGKITMSYQAAIVLISGWIAAILLLFGAIYMRSKMFSTILIVISLFAFVISTYQAYVTNCSLVGKCEALSWFLVAMGVLYAILMIIYAVRMVNMFSGLIQK
jgi:hypothetical protein